MSAKNKAKKSTGTRIPPRASTPVTANSNNSVQNRRRLSNSNTSSNSQNSFAAAEEDSDSDVPTQRLRSRTRNSSVSLQSQPGPSGISSQSTPGPSRETPSRNLRSRLPSSDSDADLGASTLVLSPTRGRRARNHREESSGDTTSDSDAPCPERVQENKKVVRKKRKITKPPLAKTTNNKRKQNQKSDSSSEPETVQKKQPTPVKLTALQDKNVSNLAYKCVYFLLVADQKKYAIKRQDILKNVFTNHDHKLYNIVMEKASNILKKTYGMEIIYSEKRKGEYLLINCLDRNLCMREYIELTPSELQKRGLIFYLLTVIFMNEKSINEDDLWEALKPLGIDVNSRTPHPVFGDVRKYITSELVKQMYLDYKCISKDPPLYEFTWGERVKQEFVKHDILQFACQILDDTKPEDWSLQYNDAKSERPEKPPDE